MVGYGFLKYLSVSWVVATLGQELGCEPWQPEPSSARGPGEEKVSMGVVISFTGLIGHPQIGFVCSTWGHH